MFNGSYLNSNIGHEFVNLFQTDSGKNYVYVMPEGKFGKIQKGKVEAVINVRNIPNEKKLEILSVATNLKEIYDPDLSISRNEKIQEKIINTECYAGKLMKDIFTGAKQQSIYVSYEAENVKIPTKYITIPYRVSGGLAKGPNRSQKIYSEEGEPEFVWLSEIIEEICSNGNDLSKLHEDEINEYKKEISEDKVGDDYHKCELSILEVLYGKGDDELAYSNAIAFLFERIPSVMLQFFNPQQNNSGTPANSICGYNEEIPGISPASNTTISEKVEKVYRELYNMDIVVTTNCRTIVIENKIRSGVNGVNDSKNLQITNQLQKYVNQFSTIKDLTNEQVFPRPIEFYLLCPEYNKILLSDYGVDKIYILKTYKELYEYLINISKPHSLFKKAQAFEIAIEVIRRFFDEFINAIRRHTLTYVDDRKPELMRKVAKIF